MFLLRSSIVLLIAMLMQVAASAQDPKPDPETNADGISYGIVIDNSGSFRKLLEDVIQFVGKVLDEQKPADESFFVRFIDTEKIKLDQELTSNSSDVRDSLENMYIEGGQTAIIDAFSAILAERRGEVTAEVTSAKPLSSAQADAVGAALRGALGRKVAIDLKVDARLIGGLKVKVALAPALAAKLPADASLFVIARQPGGPPMPVAVERLPARGFPVEVTLDDGDSPMPTLRLSQLDRVEVLARVSASGDAKAQPGDLEAVAKTAGKDSGPVELVIDQVRP